jgi:hypothetical protein
MYAQCRGCLHVYDLAELYRDRPWRPNCPECGALLTCVPPQRLRVIQERQAARQGRPPSDER